MHSDSPFLQKLAVGSNVTFVAACSTRGDGTSRSSVQVSRTLFSILQIQQHMSEGFTLFPPFPHGPDVRYRMCHMTKEVPVNVKPFAPESHELHRKVK
jgi:hypothetical protein